MDFATVATGYCVLEAPRADGDAIWFSDLLLGGLRRLAPDGTIEEFLKDRTSIGGAVLNDDGAILCGGRGGIAWLNSKNRQTGMLLDTIDGRSIPCVNDMFPDGEGGLYFGVLPGGSKEEGLLNQPTSIYRLDIYGRVTQLLGGLKFSNGIGRSPDGRRFYHNETLVGTFAYEVLSDGSLGHRTLFSEQADCDGLAVDEEGGVWIACCQSGVIIRVLPNGTVERRVSLPVQSVMSLCFGGPDRRDLYVATGGDEGVNALVNGGLPPRVASLYRTRADVAGLPVPRTRFNLPG